MLFAMVGGGGGSCDGGSLDGGGGAGGNTNSSMVQTRSSMGNLKLISLVGVVGVLACSGGLPPFTPFPLLTSKPFSIHLPLSPAEWLEENKKTLLMYCEKYGNFFRFYYRISGLL